MLSHINTNLNLFSILSEKKDIVFFSHLYFVSFNFRDVGIPFKINGVVRHFNGTIGQCLADNLGSHFFGRFYGKF